MIISYEPGKIPTETTVKAEFQLSRKDAKVGFCNKTKVSIKFQLSGKDTEV